GMIPGARSCSRKSTIWPPRAAVTSAFLLPDNRWIRMGKFCLQSPRCTTFSLSPIAILVRERSSRSKSRLNTKAPCSDSSRDFCFAHNVLRTSSFHMRLLVEIVIIGTLISLGWDTSLREWSDRATTTVQTFLHSKRETLSVVTTLPAPTAPRVREETLGKG